MSFHDKLDFHSLRGLHTLIYGETNTGKTFYTAKFVQYLLEIEKFEPKKISILDFAPKSKNFKSLKIGGQLLDFYENCIYCNYIPFKGEITPPRLSAKNKKELYANICNNYKLTSENLLNYAQNPTPFLIINDMSIYLHLGSKTTLLEIIKKSSTFLGNAYYGTSIKSKFSGLLSVLEKKRVEYFIKNIDNSFYTG